MHRGDSAINRKQSHKYDQLDIKVLLGFMCFS